MNRWHHNESDLQQSYRLSLSAQNSRRRRRWPLSRRAHRVEEAIKTRTCCLNTTTEF